METALKSIILTVAVLLILGNAVSPASAFDARKFWDEYLTGGAR
jgi:hypothetical protein